MGASDAQLPILDYAGGRRAALFSWQRVVAITLLILTSAAVFADAYMSALPALPYEYRLGIADTFANLWYEMPYIAVGLVIVCIVACRFFRPPGRLLRFSRCLALALAIYQWTAAPSSFMFRRILFGRC